MTKKTSNIQQIEIEDPVFLETYTAYVTKKGSRWRGWIPKFKALIHEAKTKKALLEALTEKLHETLEARAQAWDDQMEEDAKAGKLEHLRKEALEDIHAGRFNEI